MEHKHRLIAIKQLDDYEPDITSWKTRDSIRLDIRNQNSKDDDDEDLYIYKWSDHRRPRNGGWCAFLRIFSYILWWRSKVTEDSVFETDPQPMVIFNIIQRSF